MTAEDGFKQRKGYGIVKDQHTFFKDQRNFINNSYRKGDISPIQDGPFRGCSWMRGAQSPPPPPTPRLERGAKRSPSLKSIIHILQRWNVAQLYHDAPHDFCWHQYFFIGNQQILLYQKIQIYIAFWLVISYSFDYLQFWWYQQNWLLQAFLK